MRIIDYYNIAATVLELLLILAALFFCRKGKHHANRSEVSSQASGMPVSAATSAAEAFDAEDASTAFPAEKETHSRKYWLAALIIFAFGAFLRIWNLAGLPNGLQQDEASIGYEAFCLFTTGMDRNGFHWPVYPITWGSGGGSPIMIYLNVITTWLFGSGVWSIRIIPAVLGCLTLLLFYLLLRRGYGYRTAAMGLLVLSLTPWHIILSRWSLDSNTMPFWQILATFFIVRAALTKNRTRHQTLRYLLAAFLFGVCLYSYGSANVVIPLTLLFACIFLLASGLLSWRQLAGCFAVFLLTCTPLAIFYAVNFLGLPEISLSWISFPKFTSSHFGSVFVAFDSSLPKALLQNLKELILTLTIGLEGEVSWNAMPGYWTLYRFTWPVTFAGIAVGIHSMLQSRRLIRSGRESNLSRTSEVLRASHILDAIMLAELGAALLFSLFIQQDINREVLLFLPLVYWLVIGFRWLCRTLKAALSAHTKLRSGGHNLPRAAVSALLAALPLLLFLAGFASFARDYYGGTYNEVCATDFMPGYGDAMVLANELACEKEAEGESSTVYSTYDLVASPFMLTLYYTQYDPQEFRDTVVYKDPDAEFRVASSFGHFVFGLPVENDTLSSLTGKEYADDIFVLTKAEAKAMNPDPEEYDMATFQDRFVVVYRK